MVALPWTRGDNAGGSVMGDGSSRSAGSRVAPWIAGALLVMVGATACSASPQPAATAGPDHQPPASTRTVTAGTITASVSTTVTSTSAGSTSTAVAPAATPEPPPVDGTCPYLSDEAVAEINGQRTGTTQVVDVQPYPVCVFYRSDGGPLASIRVIRADTPQAAVAAVDQHVPIESSNPAKQPAGWTGGSMVTDAGSIYAVSKGKIAIVAESNQQQSVKGRQMVATAVQNLGL